MSVRTSESIQSLVAIMHILHSSFVEKFVLAIDKSSVVSFADWHLAHKSDQGWNVL
jgi:hypothetical protein